MQHVSDTELACSLCDVSINISGLILLQQTLLVSLALGLTGMHQ
jgi:hypothetical protein